MPKSVTPRAIPAPANNFRSEAGAVLGALHTAVAAAIAAAAPVGTNALALSRMMAIDKTLSWRMTRFVAEGDHFAASAHLPGDAAIRIFARAARERGLAAQEADRLDRAIRSLGELRKRHSKSRAEFQAMLADCRTDGATDERTAQFRRDAFMANAALGGTCARIRLLCVVHAPTGADDLGRGERIVIHGYLGLKRLRRDVCWPIGHGAVGIGAPGSMPATSGGAPIVAAFSSPSVHHAQLVRDERGHWIELPDGEVGDAGAVDVVTAERVPPGDGMAAALLRVDVPCEWGIIEVLGMPAAWDRREPRACLESLVCGHPPLGDRAPHGRHLPLPERPERIAVGVGAKPTIKEMPWHAELVQHVAPWLRSADGPATGWRLRVRHPPAPSGLSMAPDADAC